MPGSELKLSNDGFDCAAAFRIVCNGVFSLTAYYEFSGFEKFVSGNEAERHSGSFANSRSYETGLVILMIEPRTTSWHGAYSVELYVDVKTRRVDQTWWK